MAISIAKLMELKKRAGEVRDTVIQAKATMTEVDSNISNVQKELKDLGIKDVSKVSEEIEEMEQKAKELYDKSYEKLQKWI